MNDDKHNLVRSVLSKSDPANIVLESEHLVYRAITAVYAKEVQDMLDSGFIGELVKRRLIPETKTSRKEINGYPLVLEQKKINPLVYPFEWSPEMLRQAALCILRVNECANEFGFEVHDVHPFNIVFDCNRPLFVDIGGFGKPKAKNYWSAIESFRICYINNLKLFKKGYTNIFRHLFHLQGGGIHGGEIASLLHPFVTSFFGMGAFLKLQKVLSIYRVGPTIDEGSIKDKISSPWKRRTLRFVLHSSKLPFRNYNPLKLAEKVADCSYVKQDKISKSIVCDNKEKAKATYVRKCMQLLVDEVAQTDARKVLFFGCLDDVPLAKELADALTDKVKLIYASSDAISIDTLAAGDDQIYKVFFDLIQDVRENITKERAARLKSDLVIALGVMSCLISEQKYPLEVILRTLHSYTDRFIVLECTGEGESLPSDVLVPASAQGNVCFVHELSQYFNLLKKIEMEANRTILVAEKL